MTTDDITTERRPAPGDAAAAVHGSEYAIEALGLGKRYALGETTITALHDVTLRVPRGEFTAVMGPSGSGKSTLLYLMGLLDATDEGSIRLGGTPVDGLDDDALTELRRTRLGFVFQNFELIPNLSARENILLPAEVQGDTESARRRLETLAERLEIGDRLEHRPAQLSGGQRQRVAIARALVNDPLVLLADEPTGNLDSTTGREVLELLRGGVDELGWTVVMVTHDPNAAMAADRIVFLRDGRLTGEASTKSTDIRSVIESYGGI